MFDLLIKDAKVVDGTGAAAVSADVAVIGRRIVEVGRVSGAARRTLAADGRLLTPGFVDIHTHYDGQVSWDRMLAPSSAHGVTSVVMGNCGVGFAPARPDMHAFLIRLLEGVEDIPGAALAEGLTWDWESFPDYLDAVGKRSFAMDVGAQVPHAALRAYVMGERGADHAIEPSDDEIGEMERLTFAALEAGALGFSTSRTHIHRSRDGRNIGTLTASGRELLGVVRALRRSRKGVVQLISDAYLTQDDNFADAELDLVQSLAEASGRRVSLSLLQSDASPDRYRHVLARIDAMCATGLEVRAQVAPRPGGVLLSFASTTNPFMATPAFQALQTARLEARLEALADPQVKARILAEHAQLRAEGFAAQVFKSFQRMFPMADPVDYEPEPAASLRAQADRAGREPAEFAYDVFLEAGGRRLIYMPLVNYARGTLDDVFEMLAAPNTLYGLSDGGAHVASICDASYPTTTLALWSRGSKSGRRILLEALVHGYTQRNAAHMGWRDRGVVAPGYLADLNLIDLDQLALSPPTVVEDLPAGGVRLLQAARGYCATIKAGVVTFEAGVWTGATPGRLVRGAQSSRG